MKIRAFVGISFALAICFACFATTLDKSHTFEFPSEPSWVIDATGFQGSVLVKGATDISGVSIEYTYPNAETKTVVANPDAAKPGLYVFDIPAKPESDPGKLTYAAKVSFREAGKSDLRSETRAVPLALERELDITGDAAIALLYPLGGAEYTVRYVPCCNIFGGVTIATRVPVNPESSDTGLPSQRLSDFIVLKPDGLSASTMGMYFDFLLGADRMKGVTPGLYEFDGSAWVEFRTYEVDTVTGRISMHCPNGGTFVVVAKP